MSFTSLWGQIKIKSKTILYFKCGNEITVLLPKHIESQEVSFSASNRTIHYKNTNNLVFQLTVIPSAAQTVLQIYHYLSLIKELSFRVQIPPKPEIIIIRDDYTQKDTLKTKKIRHLRISRNRPKYYLQPFPKFLEIVARPDEQFRRKTPECSKFIVLGWKMTLARGSKAIFTKEIYTSRISEEDLNEFQKLIQHGDRLVIEVSDINNSSVYGYSRVNIGIKYFSIHLSADH